jgi:hypothetical protein
MKESEQPAGGGDFSGASREDLQSALFAQMVMQQANLAMMLLGKVPHPESGHAVRDLDTAKLFIDQLEMLEVKTRGNLTKPEEAFLKQSLMSLRLAFVEAVESPEPPVPPRDEPKADPAAASTNPAGAGPVEPQNKTAPAEDTGAASETESRKRFSKKFSL